MNVEWCIRRNFAGSRVGAACPDCGHTNVVHPGAHNPAVSECQLCALNNLRRNLEGRLTPDQVLPYKEER